MEKELNIAAILKDKPKGTKLWSPIFGECTFDEISCDNSYFGVDTNKRVPEIFYANGKYDENGECTIFPSKEMRDWSKFAWKEGDILVNKYGNAHVIFEGFDDDTYETFNGNNYLWKIECITMCFGEYEDELPTSDFSKANKEDAQKYIHQIEKRLGGKLNRETIEVEKAQSFKDGDIVALVVRKCTHIAIFQSRQEKYIGFHAVLCQNDELLLEEPFREDDGDIELRPATDSEKQQLFEALAKENKKWDAEQKAIVDLKPKWTPKPFDKVLVRDSKSDKWRANLFGYIGEDRYNCCVYTNWVYCIPYEGNEHLLGTTKDVEG